MKARLSKLKFISILSVFGAVLFSVFLSLASASFTPTINYQGKVTDASSTAVANGSYDVTFKLYTVPTGGTA
ncbi:MAG TPA: hypothetical protein VFM02_04030, partial [Candidatus Paceibacterota bacterium]|nr:hypothetical protein [Candidatus Paceibacterota bacterium]